MWEETELKLKNSNAFDTVSLYSIYAKYGFNSSALNCRFQLDRLWIGFNGIGFFMVSSYPIIDAKYVYETLVWMTFWIWLSV